MTLWLARTGFLTMLLGAACIGGSAVKAAGWLLATGEVGTGHLGLNLIGVGALAAGAGLVTMAAELRRRDRQ